MDLIYLSFILVIIEYQIEAQEERVLHYNWE